MKQIFVKSNGSYKDTYARAVEIANTIPDELFRGITNEFEYNEETHTLLEHMNVNYLEPGEVDTPIEITPEFIKWLDEVERKGA